MKTWIYIEARDVSAPFDSCEVSFATMQLQAANQQEAEQQGAALMDTRRAVTPKDLTNIDHQHFSGTFLNYYAVEVVPA